MGLRGAIALLLVGVILFTGCKKASTPDTFDEATASDHVINVDSEDAEMVAAIAKARASLPEFWTAFEKKAAGESDFSLKVMITDPNGVEHFWTEDLERKDGKVFAAISNEPNTVKSVTIGQRIEIPEADISDWMYMRKDKMVGNYTLRAMFKFMPEKEAAFYKSMMVDP